MIITRLSLRFFLFLGLAFNLGTLSFSISAQERGRPPALPLPLDEVRMFTEALDRIRMSYVEPVDDQTLLENAIKGMLGGLDPHSAYMAGNDYDNLQETTTLMIPQQTAPVFWLVT
jgi:carboxyl-terminal processing protease